MNQLNLFIELTRFKKPIGYMLLFWPCLWGLTLVYNFNNEIITYGKYLIFFLLGSILMRSAGCIVNDIVDIKFDKRVERTKNRPVASGKVSLIIGWNPALPWSRYSITSIPPFTGGNPQIFLNLEVRKTLCTALVQCSFDYLGCL